MRAYVSDPFLYKRGPFADDGEARPYVREGFGQVAGKDRVQLMSHEASRECKLECLRAIYQRIEFVLWLLTEGRKQDRERRAIGRRRRYRTQRWRRRREQP